MDNLKLTYWIKNDVIANNRIKSKILKKWKLNQHSSQEFIDLKEQTSFLNNNVFYNDYYSFVERIYCVLYSIKGLIKCENEHCNNKVNFMSIKKGYSKFCSLKCSNTNKDVREKYIKTCLERYGVENAFQSENKKDKIKQTNIKRYGAENVFQSNQIKEKIKQSNIEKYGVESAMSNSVIKEKIKKANLEKHGVENVFQLESVKEKIKKSNLERYGVENPSQSPLILGIIKKNNIKKFGRESNKQVHISLKSLDKLNNSKWLMKQNRDLKKTLTQISQELGVSITAVSDYFKKYNIEKKYYYQSLVEKEILKFINFNIETNNRKIISPYELDIYIPEAKLAIEFDGLYWHSYDKKETPKQKKYHLIKTEMCQEQGIQLLHIFENEWIDPTKQEIWKSMINSKLRINDRIFARKCKVEEISDTKLIRSFLKNNHLQGFAGSSIKLGLFYEDELISLMTFGKSRYSKKYQYEMIRYCNKKYINVVGGASKLFKYFTRNYDPQSIVSYADRRHSNGNMYNKLEFEHSHVSAPNYFYFKNGQIELYPRIKFQKHKLEKQLESFDPELSEVENMFNNNYRRIWDCGNIIYIWTK